MYPFRLHLVDCYNGRGGGESSDFWIYFWNDFLNQIPFDLWIKTNLFKTRWVSWRIMLSRERKDWRLWNENWRERYSSIFTTVWESTSSPHRQHRDHHHHDLYLSHHYQGSSEGEEGSAKLPTPVFRSYKPDAEQLQGELKNQYNLLDSLHVVDRQLLTICLVFCSKLFLQTMCCLSPNQRRWRRRFRMCSPWPRFAMTSPVTTNAPIL